ncbi:MAG: hypothetical protein IKW01_04060 [Firmicutes bacterium]|nr:hypothetical protein [Bacillota bacterium]
MKRLVRKVISLIVVLSFVFAVPIAEAGSSFQFGRTDNAAYAAEADQRIGRANLENKSQIYIYDKYLAAIKSGKSYCKFDTKKYKVNEENLSIAEYAIWHDYPEYGYWDYFKRDYWWYGTETNKNIEKVDIYYDKTLKNKSKELSARVKAIIKSIPEDCVTDYDKALYLHDFICDNTVYIDEATEDEPWPPKQQTAFGPIVYGKAVCEGYARAYQLLLQEAGIQALTVYGYSLMNENSSFEQINSYIKYDGKDWAGHAWNVVWLDDKCYYFDVTADDPADPDADCYYNCFAKSREEYDKTYLVRVGETVDETLDSFQKKMLGRCGHEDLVHRSENYVFLTEPLDDIDLNGLIRSFGPTQYRYKENTEEPLYGKDVYFTYDGLHADVDMWIAENMMNIFKAIGFKGDYYNHDIYWLDFEAGEFLLEVIGTDTADNVLKQPLNKPIVASIKNSTKKQIQLKWYEVDGADKYEIYRKVSKNGTYKKIKTTTKLSFIDRDLKKGKTYYYKLKAISTENAKLNSKFSAVTSAKI